MKGIMRFYIFLFTLSTIIGGCSGINSEKNGLVRETLVDCPDRPNCVSSKAHDKKHAVEPFLINGDPIKAWEAVADILRDYPRTTIVKMTDHYLHAECKSLLFRFVDDLELQLDPSAKVIEIRSASRTGYYDFGVNRRRVSHLRQILQDNSLIH